jgi:hypothetical protein
MTQSRWPPGARAVTNPGRASCRTMNCGSPGGLWADTPSAADQNAAACGARDYTFSLRLSGNRERRITAVGSDETLGVLAKMRRRDGCPPLDLLVLCRRGTRSGAGGRSPWHQLGAARQEQRVLAVDLGDPAVRPREPDQRYARHLDLLRLLGRHHQLGRFGDPAGDQGSVLRGCRLSPLQRRPSSRSASTAPGTAARRGCVRASAQLRPWNRRRVSHPIRSSAGSFRGSPKG